MPSISRRIPFAAVAALAVASLAAAPQAAPAVSGKASVKVGKCKSAAMYADRELVFRSSMSSIATGGKMQMRIVLFRRYREQKKFHIVKPTDPGSALAGWQESSDPSATKYVNNFSISPVETRTQYRVKAYYRWRDAAGNIVARASRSSDTCVQTRSLPDLTVDGIKKFPNPGAVFPQFPVIYEITVTNIGRSSAWLPSEPLIAAVVNGSPLVEDVQPSPFTYDTVPAKSSVTRSYYGPECAGTPPTIDVTIDPNLLIREANRRNNLVSTHC